MEEAASAVHVTVRGIVQGVGFRFATQRMARRLGLEGWVRNAPDGALEVFVQGALPELDEMVEFLGVGPSLAEVADANVLAAEPDPSLEGFDVLL